jgi:hypothetical protein
VYVKEGLGEKGIIFSKESEKVVGILLKRAIVESLFTKKVGANVLFISLRASGDASVEVT